MRISDWSSDVCSSDLNATYRCNFLQDGSCRLYPGRRYDGSSSGAMAPNTGRSDGRSFNNSREGRNMLLTTLKHAAKHAALGVGLALRSEEHTSELQSLMRISYAVFCLKKKKKNKMKHVTNTNKE